MESGQVQWGPTSQVGGHGDGRDAAPEKFRNGLIPPANKQTNKQWAPIKTHTHIGDDVQVVSLYFP